MVEEPIDIGAALGHGDGGEPGHVWVLTLLPDTVGILRSVSTQQQVLAITEQYNVGKRRSGEGIHTNMITGPGQG